MSDEIVIPPANAAATGFISRNHNEHHGHHDYAHTAERVIGSVHQAERNLETNSRNFEGRSFDQTAGVKDAVTHGTEETIEGFAANGLANAIGFKDGQAVAYQIEGRAGLEAAKNFYALNVQAERTFNALTVQATANAAAAELSAQKIAAVAAAQAAECCCELKELIRAENGQTRDLINANTVQGLRDALLAAQRFIPLTVPVPL